MLFPFLIHVCSAKMNIEMYDKLTVAYWFLVL